MGRNAKLKPTKDQSKRRWYVCIPARISSTGKWRREYFQSKAKAEERCRELKSLDRQKDSYAAQASPRLMRDAVECEQLAQMYGYSGIREAFIEWSKTFEKRKSMITLEELMESYRQDREKNWSKGYISTRWKPFCKFLDPIKDEPLSTLTTDFWREWLGAWVEEKDPAANTYNPRLSLLRGLFNHEKAQEFFQHNPLKPIVAQKNEHKEVCVATTEEVENLMVWCSKNDSELIPYFAIGFFAGLRPMAELEILKFDQINFEEDVISVITTKTASKRRRQVPIESNLLKWIEPFRNTQGLIIPSNFRKRHDRAKKESGIKWGHDIMRHSYGSYWEAKYRKEAGCREQLSYNMGHSSFKTYEQYYRNDRAKDEADRYWSV